MSILIAFANSEKNPLPTLREEDNEVHKILSRRVAKSHFQVHRDSYATLDSIVTLLQVHRDNIEVFLFSGHADRDKIIFADTEASALGVAKLLNKCPRLKLVILNGCATANQVSRLQQLKSDLVIIATSAPVSDRAATLFSISFFRSFCDQYSTIEDAFNFGLDAAQTASNTELSTRAIELRTTEKEAVWGIFGNDLEKEWTLPNIEIDDPPKYLPNKVLINTLLKSYAPYNNKINEVHQDTSAAEDLTRKRHVIVANLTEPVSRHVKKLLVEDEAAIGGKLYNKLGRDRLIQLWQTFHVVISLTGFIILAELWEQVSRSRKESNDTQDGGQPVELSSPTKVSILNFLQSRSKEGESKSYFELFKNFKKEAEVNGFKTYINDFNNLVNDLLNSMEFCDAVQFMCTLGKQLYSNDTPEEKTIKEKCIIGEEKLSIILAPLHFLTAYDVASVKNINFKNHRGLDSARFIHSVAMIIVSHGGSSFKNENLDEAMTSQSILLIKKEEQLGQKFLNLTPFIVDINNFQSHSTVPKLFYLDSYVKKSDAFELKYLNKPDDRPKIIKHQDEYKSLRIAFDSFAMLLFNKPLKEAK